MVLLAVLSVGLYSIWDSKQVDEGASSAQWQPYRPIEGETMSFDQLRDKNPDVKAWLSIYGTYIDYPVCWSDDELKYLQTNAHGEYALSGALFIAAADDYHFSQYRTIIYGHHMEREKMFGPIDNFLEKDYFDEHRYGQLFYDDKAQGLEIIALIKTDAYDRSIYGRPDDSSGYMQNIKDKALYYRDESELDADDRVVIMSTCSSESTNARTILVGKITDETYPNSFVETPNYGTGVDELAEEVFFGMTQNVVIAFVSAFILIVIIIIDYIIIYRRKKRRDRIVAEIEADKRVDSLNLSKRFQPV